MTFSLHKCLGRGPALDAMGGRDPGAEDQLQSQAGRLLLSGEHRGTARLTDPVFSQKKTDQDLCTSNEGRLKKELFNEYLRSFLKP